MIRPRTDTMPRSVTAFLAAPHLATMSTVRPDGSLHVTAVRFTWDGDAGLARVLTVATARKARNLTTDLPGRAALCQVQGFRWVTLEGTATVSADSRRVDEGVRRYAHRYGSPPPNPLARVVIEIDVEHVLELNSGLP